MRVMRRPRLGADASACSMEARQRHPLGSRTPMCQRYDASRLTRIVKRALTGESTRET
jgi:hypothetical protein